MKIKPKDTSMEIKDSETAFSKDEIVCFQLLMEEAKKKMKNARDKVDITGRVNGTFTSKLQCKIEIDRINELLLLIEAVKYKPNTVFQLKEAKMLKGILSCCKPKSDVGMYERNHRAVVRKLDVKILELDEDYRPMFPGFGR